MARKIKLSTTIILMVEVILLISSVLFCTVSIYRSRVGIRQSIQQRMLDIANCASGSVNGDVLGSLTEDDVGSDEYNELYKTLSVFRDNVELEYVYSIKEVGNGEFIFTMDTAPDAPASFGDSVKYTDALAAAGKGKASVDEVPYSDSWGQFYSAYSPVIDSSGKVAGIVAVDFSAEWFDSQLSEQTRSTVLGYIIILLFTLLLAAVLSLITVRPFVRLQSNLMEEKLRAESANRAKSDFLANMSHEIRTPINAVLGMNEMVLREGRRAQDLVKDESQEVREALKNINVYSNDVESAGHNLLAIVNDILDFSKIEAGRMDLIEAPYQLSSLLNDLSNMILLKAQDKGLEFSIEVDQSLPDELCGDEVRVRQVLINILNNAVKYTERGSVKLSLRGDVQDDSKIILTAVVEDTGIGIKSEDLEKLFVKFGRLEMERNSTVEGTGLGLVITQRLLEMMDGSIDVKSEYGQGSVFTITIPQKVVSEKTLGDFQARFESNVLESGAYRESFRAPEARILIVDDTKINLTVASNLLKNTQLQIDTANSGAEAVDMASKISYDAILMDQRMPEMEGTEALHRIRDLEGAASREAPVICLTADAVVGAKERYLAEGFSDYLTKPIDSHSLEKMLIKHLPQNKVQRVREEQESKRSDEGPKDDYENLVSAGIDPREGLANCQNDDEFYKSLLKEFALEEKDKSENLKKCYSSENWHDYSIYAHALKSSSRTIGALELSEIAAKLEKAANEGDADTVRSEHDRMIELYEKVTSAEKSFEDWEAEPTVEDDDILEFIPDEE